MMPVSSLPSEANTQHQDQQQQQQHPSQTQPRAPWMHAATGESEGHSSHYHVPQVSYQASFSRGLFSHLLISPFLSVHVSLRAAETTGR